MSFIKLEKVNKVYVNKKNISTALNKVSLNFNMGEVVGIVGKSGSGKTTLINIIFGIESFDEGNLYVNDIKSDEMTRDEWDKFRQQECAFIFQDLKIFDNLTVYENIELGLLNIDEEERKKIIFEYLKKFELDDFWDKKSYKLSGGQKQKVAIIRVLAKNAKLSMITHFNKTKLYEL